MEFFYYERYGFLRRFRRLHCSARGHHGRDRGLGTNLLLGTLKMGEEVAFDFEGHFWKGRFGFLGNRVKRVEFLLRFGERLWELFGGERFELLRSPWGFGRNRHRAGRGPGRW
ncbi:MAG: hypothetical protein HUU37_08000 [Bdellovibrionales bacterium]|nr:hypothetical protein [Bdellovibrionales bacterium]